MRTTPPGVSFRFTFLLIAAGVIALVPTSVPLNAATFTLTSAAPTTNWSDTTRWNGGTGSSYPGQSAGDIAIISLNGFTMNVDVVIPNGVVLQVSGTAVNVQILSGDQLLLSSGSSAVSSDTFFLSGGTFGTDTGAAVTNFQAPINMGFGTFFNGGTISLSAPFGFTGGTLGGPGTITNNAGQTMSLTGSSGSMFIDGAHLANFGTLVYASTFGPLSLINGGTIVNQSGATFIFQNNTAVNTNNVGSPLITNNGTIVIASPGGTTMFDVAVDSAGSVNAGASGMVTFAGGGTYSGIFQGNSVAFTNGTHTFNAGVALTASITQVGGAGGTYLVNTPLTVAGTFEQVGGTIAGTSTLTAAGTFNWSGGDQDGSAGGSTVIGITGTMNVQPVTPARLIGNRALISTGTIEFQSDQGIGTDGTAVHIDANGGLVEKIGPIRTLIQPVLNVSGATLRANAGTLAIGNGGTIGGGATLDTISPGAIEFAGGTTTVAPVTIVNGFLYALTGGTLLANAPVTMPQLAMSGGVLGGFGTVTISNLFHWTGGTLDGSSLGSMIVDFSATTTIDGALPTFVTNGYTLTTSSTVHYAPAVPLSVDSGAHIINNGTWKLENTTGMLSNGFSGPSFTNGAILSSSNGGTTTIAVPLTNGGLISLNNASLTLTGGGNIGGTVSAGASTDILELQTNLFFWSGNFGGGGLLRVSSGTIQANGSPTVGNFELTGTGTLTGSGNFTVSNSLSWNGGSMTGTGTTASTGTTTFTNGPLLLQRNMTVAGATFSAAAGLQIDSTLTNQFGDFNITSGSITGNGTLFNNNTIQKTTTAVASVAAVISGAIVDVIAGELQLTGNGIDTFGPLTGGGTLTLNRILDLTGPSSIGTFNLIGGELRGSNLTINSGGTWSGGAMTGAAGTTTVAAGATFTIAPTASATLQSHVLLNLGRTILGSAATQPFNIENGSSIDNQGVFDIDNVPGTATIFGPVTLTNSGTLNRLAGPASPLSTRVLNSGTINIIGSLTVPNGVSQSAGTLSLQNGTIGSTVLPFTFDGGSITGTGTIDANVNINSGATVDPGVPAAPGVITISKSYNQVTGTLHIDLFGNGTNDRLALADMSHNGLLQTAFGGGYTPASGDSNVIVTYANRNGSDFTPKTFPPFGPSNLGSYNFVYDDTAGTLTMTAFIAEADLAIGTITESAPPVNGQPWTITIPVTNNGPLDATNVQVTINATNGAITTATTSAGSCSGTAPSVCTIASLLNGATATIDVTIIPSSAGPVSATATVTATEPDLSAANNTGSINATASPAADLSLAIGDAPDPAIGGMNVTYTYIVTNNGPDASAGSINVTLSSGVITSAPGCTINTATTATCTFPSIASTGTASFTIVVASPPAATSMTASGSVATSGGPADPNTANDSAAQTTTITPVPDLVVSKTHAGLQFTITVTNNGAGATSGTAQLVDTLPTNMTATSMSGSGWTCDLPTTTCTSSDAIGAGLSYPPITLDVSVPQSSSPQTYTNNVTVSGGGEIDATNDMASDSITVSAASADFGLAITDGPDPVLPNGNVTYIYTVTNGGPDFAAGSLAVSVSAGAISSAPGCTINTPATATCPVASLASSGSTSFTVVVTAPSSGTTMTANGAVSVTAPPTDLFPANDTASQSTAITQLSSDFALAITDTPDPVTPGGGVTYTYTVTNNGPDAAAGSLAVTLSAGTIATAGGCTLNTPTTATCAIPSLGASGTTSFTIVVTAPSAGASMTAGGTVTVTAPPADLAPANDTASQTTTISASASIPTLSESMLLLLAMAMAVVAIRVLR